MAKSYQHTRKKKEYAAVEIEKLKAEIENIRDVEVSDGTVYVSSDDVNEILDQRITELKGENK